MIVPLVLVALVVSLFVYAVYHFCRDVEQSIPGMKPTDPIEGNYGDIRRAGSLHEFLVNLHAEKGDIVSFWMGPQMTVSIASPRLFKSFTKPHNRPVDLYALLDMVFTTKSLATAVDEDWRQRRSMYNPAFCRSAMTNYYELISDTMSELVSQLEGVPPGEHVGLMKCVNKVLIKSTTRCILGADFTDENIENFYHSFDYCWAEVEKQMAGNIPASNSERMQTFYRMRQMMTRPVLEAVANRRQRPARSGEQFLVDTLIEHEVAEDVMNADILTFVGGGYHTNAQLCTWLIYYIASHSDVQTKLFDELKSVIGDGEVTPANIEDLTYVRQVINETMRVTAIDAWTARTLDESCQLAGYTIPAKTPVLQAIGTVMMDPRIWPDPHRFDPERFSPTNASMRPSLSFEPFGFAGKRKCPGYLLAYLEATIFLSLLIPKYKFELVEGQSIGIEYGLASKPTCEIWVTVEKKN